MKEKKIRRKLLSIVLIMVVTISLLPISMLIDDSVAEAAATINLKATKISGNGDWTEKFTGGGYEGLCARANYKVYGSQTYTLHDPDNYSRNQLMRKLAYYYGYKKGWTSGGNGCQLARAFNYVSTQAGNVNAGKAYHFSKSTLQGMVNTVKKVDIPEGFHVYFAIPTGNTAWQAAVIWKMEPYGNGMLIKTSSDSKATSAGLGYSFKGIRYTVYSGSKAVGVLTCKASGKSNTISLPVGTYTVKETKTNSDFKKNKKTYTLKIRSGKTSVLKVSDAPEYANIKIVKKMADAGYKGSLAFTFKLKNVGNPAIKYTVKTNEKGEASVKVLKGIYTCEEVLTPAQQEEFRDETGTQKSTRIKTGETYTFTRTNRQLEHRSLTVRKQVDDDGSAEGFRFRVTGELYNAGTMTSAAALETISPEITYDSKLYTIGKWKISDESLKALNQAASERKAGERSLVVTNKLTYKGARGITVNDIILSAGYDIPDDTESAAGESGPGSKSEKDSSSDEKSSGASASESVKETEKETETESETDIHTEKDTEKTDSDGTDSEETENDQGGTPKEAESESVKDPADAYSPGTAVISKGTLVNDSGKGYTAVRDAEYEYFVHKASGSSAAEIDRDRTAASIRALLGDSDSFTEINLSDIDISVSVPVDLKGAQYVYNSSAPDKSGYETSLSKQIRSVTPAETRQNVYSVKYNRFVWYGAATEYQEIVNGKPTGKNYAMLTTDKKGNTAAITEGIQAGKFSVEEIMTDEQNARYRQPAVQSKEVLDGNYIFSFSFINNSRRTPVRLLKMSRDGNIAGIEFTLAGTREFDGQEINISGVTDENGGIDFGSLYKGKYTITETGFDSENYLYPKGWDRNSEGLPVKNIEVTGEEVQDIVIDIENIPMTSLYLTKVDKDTQIFLDNSKFELLEGDKKVAEFRILRDDSGNTAIDLLWTEEGSDIYAEKPDVTPEPEDYSEEPGDTDSSESDEEDTTVVTPENDEQTPDEATEEAEDTPDNDTAEYDYGVLKGLRDGAEYTIREIVAPAGYCATIDFTFGFEDGKKLVLENESPKIRTTALDQGTKSHMSDAEGTVTIIDKVEYRNLTPGQEYKMTGRLAYRPEMKDGNPAGAEETETVVDAAGKEVTKTVTFTPENADGSVDIEFTFEASLLDNRKTVVFEELSDPSLTAGADIVAVHVDPDDEGQSIYFPELKTSASADDTHKHITNADEEISITDVVTYSNIIAGNEYEVTGTLMNRETGKPVMINGKPVTASRKFIAGAENTLSEDTPDNVKEKTEDENKVELVSGEISLTFTFNGSALAGNSLVVFEKLYLNGNVVGEHSDIDDKDQTVEIPKIGTQAARTDNNMITDHCSYSNLIPGEKYVMFGYLVDKADNSYIEESRAQVEFIPDKPDGTVDVELEVNAGELRNHKVVAFEQCYMEVISESEENDKSQTGLILVASHQDINDEGQTVDLSESPKTGDSGKIILFCIMGVLSAAVLTLMIMYRRINTKKQAAD